MLLLLRSMLALGLVTLVHSTRKVQSVSAKSERGTGVKDKMVRLVLHPSMVPQITSMSPSSVANMSLSPWTYRDSYVESRLPQKISNAECQTTGCLSLQGDGEDISLEAKPSTTRSWSCTGAVDVGIIVSQSDTTQSNVLDKIKFCSSRNRLGRVAALRHGGVELWHAIKGRGLEDDLEGLARCPLIQLNHLHIFDDAPAE
ncbi:hypothetical protein INR49_004391, partial [Caranx melampygus]